VPGWIGGRSGRNLCGPAASAAAATSGDRTGTRISRTTTVSIVFILNPFAKAEGFFFARLEV
jgi:hypothetical protein